MQVLNYIDMEDIFENNDSKEIDYDDLFSGEAKVTYGQLGMIEHLLYTARGLDSYKQKQIEQEMDNYTEEKATEIINYLKQHIPILDCRKQFEKMCRDGVFKPD